MPLWLAIIISFVVIVFLVLSFTLSLHLLVWFMGKLGRNWEDITDKVTNLNDYAVSGGLSLTAPFLTDKNGNTYFGAYITDYNKTTNRLLRIWLIKP